MENLILGFLTGGSLILAIGPQNLFVIEQGLKRNFVFTITTICAVSDILLIFLGIFIYHIFDTISLELETILLGISSLLASIDSFELSPVTTVITLLLILLTSLLLSNISLGLFSIVSSEDQRLSLINNFFLY